MRKNFQVNLALATGKNVESNDAYIFFNNGYAYATDHYLMVRQALDLHEFEDEEIELLNGKAIHKETFADLYKYEIIRVILEADKTYILGEKGKVKAKYELQTPSEIGITTLNFESVIPQHPKDTSLGEFSVNVKLLERAQKLLIEPNSLTDQVVNIKLHQLRQEGKFMFMLRSLSYEYDKQIVILMPYQPE